MPSGGVFFHPFGRSGRQRISSRFALLPELKGRSGNRQGGLFLFCRYGLRAPKDFAQPAGQIGDKPCGSVKARSGGSQVRAAITTSVDL